MSRTATCRPLRLSIGKMARSAGAYVVASQTIPFMQQLFESGPNDFGSKKREIACKPPVVGYCI